MELFDLKLELGKFLLEFLSFSALGLKLKTVALELSFGLDAALLHDKTGLRDFLLELSLLFSVWLDQRKESLFLVTFDISHEELILRLEIRKLVQKS